jgi:hypothetical protein
VVTETEPSFSPLTASIAELIHRNCIKVGPGDWAENAAVLIVKSGPIRDGLAALDHLDAVLALHAPHRWEAPSPTVECHAGCGSWPCETYVLAGGAE